MKSIFIDDYFHIGRAHLNGGSPCQDYSRAGVFGDTAFAIVSDGCSSGGNTDIGARITVLSLMEAMRVSRTFFLIDNLVTESENDITKQRSIMNIARESLGIVPNDMLATCVYTKISPNGGCIHVRGDGVVAIKNVDGLIRAIRFKWDNNTPLYPVYGDDLYATFIEAHGGDLNAPVFVEESVIMNSAGVILDESYVIQHTLKDGIKGIRLPISKEQVDTQIEFIAVFSDGVEQVDGMEWTSVVAKLLEFKNKTGFFAKRRMIRFIKDVQQEGRGPIDDIAYAVIGINHELEEEADE